MFASARSELRDHIHGGVDIFKSPLKLFDVDSCAAPAGGYLPSAF
jgi:hypothetical protein